MVHRPATGPYLCGLEHELCRVVQISQRALGEAMRTCQHCADLHVGTPRVVQECWLEAREEDEGEVAAGVDHAEIPPVAETGMAQKHRKMRRKE